MILLKLSCIHLIEKGGYFILVRLFRTWSIIDNFKGKNGVVFNWRCRYREKPVAPYSELIRDYDPSCESAQYEEEYVDELLTEDEVNELKKYLKEVHNTDLYIKEIELPVDFKNKFKSQGVPIGDCKGYLPFSSMLVGHTNFYMLNKEKEYNLNIPIWAYYDLENCLPTVEIERKQLKDGIKYVEVLLKELDVEGINQKEIENAVKNVYDKFGLYVELKQDKTREERIKDKEMFLKKLEEDY